MTKSNCLLDVNELSKTYTLSGDQKGFHALKQISFQVNTNETVGLIGLNGSGKSTLLKIISGYIKPSSGEVKIYGKINSLIEIGSNFIPDLSGRENVKQFLHLHGVSKDSFPQKIKEIESFAEIGDFFDQPVKFYSSGMFVRLAIASGFHIQADIFLIDEVLMAGDQAFRTKITAHFARLTQNGVCLMLASHNPREIVDNCTKVLWLENGEIKFFGEAKEGIDQYYDQLARQRSEQNYTKEALYLPNTIDSFSTLDKSLKSNDSLTVNELLICPIKKEISYSDGFKILFSFTKKNVNQKIHPLFKIYDADLKPILILVSSNHKKTFDLLNEQTTARIDIECLFPAKLLSAGTYYLELMAGENPEVNKVHTKEVFRLKTKIRFEVADSNFDFTGATQNIFIKPNCVWSIK